MERAVCIFISVVAVVASTACNTDDTRRPRSLAADATDAGRTADAHGVPPPPDHAMPTAEASVPQCSVAGDCAEPQTDPAGCAVAECKDGRCIYHTKDADGDGYYANDGCRITDGSAPLISGDDCEDGDATVNPGEWDGPAGNGPDGTEEPDRCNLKDDNCDGLGDNQKTDKASCACAEQDHQSCWAHNDGTPILYPQNQLKGTCHKGFQICEGGHWSPCYNAQAPQPETCDGLDNDCNGAVDDNAVDEQPYYCDRDKDDHIALDAKPVVTCPSNLDDCPGGIWRAFESVENLHDDCDDTDPNRFTGNIEICDDVDNDCDPEGLVDQIRDDDGGVTDLKVTYYRDQDGDGFGDPNGTKHVCPEQLDGYVSTPGDCDDSNKAVHPTAPESCNGIDDDCDGKIDAADPKLSGMPQMTGTTFACVNGAIVITQCPGATGDCNKDYHDGCETDETTLANCHGCNTACAFSCGETGCDGIVSISAGSEHTCALTTGRVAVCWGSNEAGELGDNDVANGSSVPIVVSGLPAPVQSIRAGMRDTCAVAGPDSKLFCWGDNTSQQCGASRARGSASVPAPEAVDNVDTSVAVSLVNVTRFALNEGHACAVYNKGHVACWGSNLTAQVGPPSQLDSVVGHANAVHRADQTASGAEVTDALDVAAGGYHTCLLTQSGSVECWGFNADGEVGTDPATDQVDWPHAVAGLERVTEISAGDFFTCALVDSGDVYCWGDNSSGQLGNDGGPSERPLKVTGVSNVQHIAAGAGFACALSTNSTLTCWGQDASGQCGVSPVVAQVTPKLVDIANVAMPTAGNAHACAVDSRHNAYCWGDNKAGQLGLGDVDTDHHAVPTLVKPLKQ